MKSISAYYLIVERGGVKEAHGIGVTCNSVKSQILVYQILIIQIFKQRSVDQIQIKNTGDIFSRRDVDVHIDNFITERSISWKFNRRAL